MARKVNIRKISQERGECIADDAALGFHVHEIAKKYGVQYRQIYYWCNKHSVDWVRCNCNKQKPSALKVVALRQRGLSQSQVAEKMSITKQRVNQICLLAQSMGVKKMIDRKKRRAHA